MARVVVVRVVVMVEGDGRVGEWVESEECGVEWRLDTAH